MANISDQVKNNTITIAKAMKIVSRIFQELANRIKTRQKKVTDETFRNRHRWKFASSPFSLLTDLESLACSVRQKLGYILYFTINQEQFLP